MGTPKIPAAKKARAEARIARTARQEAAAAKPAMERAMETYREERRYELDLYGQSSEKLVTIIMDLRIQLASEKARYQDNVGAFRRAFVRLFEDGKA
jgi:hypothetical protein